MNSHKISYCNSNGFLLKNDRSKFDIITNIKNRLGYDFLNPMQKSYSDRLLPVIKKNNSLCTYITTGKNVYMFLTKIYNENICLIIELETNKSNKYPKIISVPCNFEDKLFENETLFSGEIYRDFKNNWFFLIEKIIIYKGNLYKKNILSNIKLCNEILKNSYKYINLSPFVVKMKKYFTLDSITENIDNLNIKLKGIKFLGLKSPICFYFTTSFYNKEKNIIPELPKISNNLTRDKNKIKEEYRQEKDIDLDIIDKLINYREKQYCLELRKSNIYGIYSLFALSDKKLRYVGIARIDTIEMSLELINLMSSQDAIIVKALLDKNFKKFTIQEIQNKNDSLISNYSNIIKELDTIELFPKPNYIN